MSQLGVAIIGLGPWGLCVLERLLSRFRKLDHPDQHLVIHAYDGREAGPGVHSPAEPPYLLLNTVAGQVSLFAGAQADGTASELGAKTFLDWVRANGYRIVDGECVESTSGRQVEPGDFLPRAILGRYLKWVYARLGATLPPRVRLERHAQDVVDIERVHNRERVVGENGESTLVDHVVLTVGHTSNLKNDERILEPYPVAALQERVAAGSTVAISGMGLVAVDVLTTLTLGRGGRFVQSGSRLSYLPSGREPRVRLFSRNGLCFRCRPRTTRDQTGEYAPAVFTRERIAELRQRAMSTSGSPQLDFEREILPLLWSEITLFYLCEQQRHQKGARHAARLKQQLVQDFFTGDFMHSTVKLAKFNPEQEFFRPDLDSQVDSFAYQRAVREELEADVEDSRRGEHGSPRKAAFELLRVLRDLIREAVDNGGLTTHSLRAFRRNIAGPINRVIVGPPLQRGQELLALMDAGIVTIPFGREPRVAFEATTGWRIASTRLVRPHQEDVDHLIAGHLPQPTVENSGSMLLRKLFARGRLLPFDQETNAGALLDRQSHPMDRHGNVEPRLWVLGPLAEGVRYFNHYLPSPKSRYRAFSDADACVRHILGAEGLS